MINEELAEHTRQEVIDHLKPKVPEKSVPIDAMLVAKSYNSLSDTAKRRVKLPSNFGRTLIKAHQKMKKCGKTVPQLGTQQKIFELLRVQTDKKRNIRRNLCKKRDLPMRRKPGKKIFQYLKLQVFHISMENLLSPKIRRSI
ncbi:hypothetical protein PAHAL_7G347000 [Panicum hallii]|uniref:Uncharacterized protein n=1 Tax=Panicum hallii TaxID=206008 RepID=A0A2T8IEG8_9POAL|nr:hypothetical protein PAHAL_7G347000 [Panicum hallii]